MSTVLCHAKMRFIILYFVSFRFYFFFFSFTDDWVILSFCCFFFLFLEGRRRERERKMNVFRVLMRSNCLVFRALQMDGTFSNRQFLNVVHFSILSRVFIILFVFFLMDFRWTRKTMHVTRIQWHLYRLCPIKYP